MTYEARNLPDSEYVRMLQSEHDAIMEEYCEWRRNDINSHIAAEGHEYRQKLDQYRRRIASAKAPPSDVENRMRLLENWSDPAETGTRYEFETAHGTYAMWVNEVTHVWLVRTPEGDLEGPFFEALDAADWASVHWYEVYRDPEQDAT